MKLGSFSATMMVCYLILTGLAAAEKSTLTALNEIDRLLDEELPEEAETLLKSYAANNPASARLHLLSAQLLFLQGEYARADQMLRQIHRPPKNLAQALRRLRGLISAAQNSLAAGKTFSSTGKHFSLLITASADELLVPFASETLENIYQAMNVDLGYAPPKTVRVEIYDSLDRLAQNSTVSREDLLRSGTVAVTKFDRVMMLSPRLFPQGFPWRDTLAHEYVHLIVHRLSLGGLPVWAQEGLAKMFEPRWRLPADQNARLTPTQEHLLAEALKQNKLVSWEAMSPSLARLPNQVATILAFAEAQTAMQMLRAQINLAGLRKLIFALREANDIWPVIYQLSGWNKKTFNWQFRRYLRGLNLQRRPALIVQELRPGQRPTSESYLATISQEKGRQHLQLAEMLRKRQLNQAAIIEYRKARAIVGPLDEFTATQMARTYLQMSNPEQALAALQPLLELWPESVEAQTMAGLAKLRANDEKGAQAHLQLAFGLNPFSTETHCLLAEALKKIDATRAALHLNWCQKMSTM